MDRSAQLSSPVPKLDTLKIQWGWMKILKEEPNLGEDQWCWMKVLKEEPNLEDDHLNKFMLDVKPVFPMKADVPVSEKEDLVSDASLQVQKPGLVCKPDNHGSFWCEPHNYGDLLYLSHPVALFQKSMGYECSRSLFPPGQNGGGLNPALTKPGPQTTTYFMCDLCGRQFSFYTNLKRHLLMHSEIKQQTTCEDCGQVFSCVLQASKHTRLHVKPYCCDRCGVIYKDYRSLRGHINRVHIGEKFLICADCGASFYDRRAVADHLRRHVRNPMATSSLSIQLATNGANGFLKSGERKRPYQCHVCGHRSFTRRHLERHKKIHTGDKPFCCHVCGHGFLRRNHWVTHVTTRIIECEVCGAKMCNKRRMERHQREHQGVTRRARRGIKKNIKCRKISKHQKEH